MNTYDIKVSFKDGTIFSPNIELVKNDIKSAIFVFDFDVDDPNYTKVFQMKVINDDTAYSWSKEIVDNKIVLYDKNEETEEIFSVINKSGSYEYDIVLYDGKSKITTTQTNSFYVRDSIVDNSDESLEESDIALIDDLINQNVEIKEKLKEIDDINNRLQELEKLKFIVQE